MAASALRLRKMGALTRVKDSGGPAAQNFWAVALVVAFAAFMEVLDLTIVNVSLLHIMGSMAVSQNKAIWVLTAYTMTNAIILPLSGWLATRLGRKRYFMGCIAAFSVTSLLCGLSPNFSTLVIFRALQGIAGGGLQPNAQAILTDAAPAAKRGMAFAVYGMAVVFAPAIGPTVGGWITDHIGWRWIFLINVPIGLLILPLVQALVHDPESFAQARGAQLASSRRADFVGFALITLGLGLMQVVLDRGQQDGWFASLPIVTMTITWILALAFFVVREWRKTDPIVDLRLLRDPGFAAGNVLMFMLGALLLGSTALLPLFMQSLLGYTAVDAGLVLSPGGAGHHGVDACRGAAYFASRRPRSDSERSLCQWLCNVAHDAFRHPYGICNACVDTRYSSGGARIFVYSHQHTGVLVPARGQVEQCLSHHQYVAEYRG